MVIGLPPVLNFAKKELKERVVRDVLSGKKRICLAITEPIAGSDVGNLWIAQLQLYLLAGIETTAVKTADGKHYIVNGVKVFSFTSTCNSCI